MAEVSVPEGEEQGSQYSESTEEPYKDKAGVIESELPRGSGLKRDWPKEGVA